MFNQWYMPLWQLLQCYPFKVKLHDVSLKMILSYKRTHLFFRICILLARTTHPADRSMGGTDPIQKMQVRKIFAMPKGVKALRW